MGGVAGGQVASSLVLSEAKKILSEEVNNLNPENLKEILEKIFIGGQNSIRERISSEPSLSGMGTYCSASHFIADLSSFSPILGKLTILV